MKKKHTADMKQELNPRQTLELQQQRENVNKCYRNPNMAVNYVIYYDLNM